MGLRIINVLQIKKDRVGMKKLKVIIVTENSSVVCLKITGCVLSTTTFISFWTKQLFTSKVKNDFTCHIHSLPKENLLSSLKKTPGRSE